MLLTDFNFTLVRKVFITAFLLLFLTACGGSSEIVGVDANATGSSTDDNDNDGIADNVDNCPGIANADQADSDNDGIGDLCDGTSGSANTSDGDNDGVNNANDNCPNVANADQADTDNDGIGDACDSNNSSASDGDNDGVADAVDNCPNVANANQADTDLDGIGDACDTTQTDPNNTDSDNDGYVDASDNCPQVANPSQTDTDNDGLGDACDTVTTNSNIDSDNDGVVNSVDNCVVTSNANQTDSDNDGVGDACDQFDNTDSDTDGVADVIDNCPSVPNANQADADNDGVGDACDTVLDSDNDGVADDVDNCPSDANANQADADNNGVGDVCDPSNDGDSDGVIDSSDNCPTVANPNQTDADNDGVGDACDNLIDTDNDGVADSTDNCLTTPNSNQADADNNGVGDACEGAAGDQFPGTPNIVDSFGQTISPDVSGPPWMAINAHYSAYPPAAGECSQAVHNSYWVQSPEDGKYYPTWHPSVDASGCVFGHEHGDDPRGSDLYETSGGIPFGFVHSRLMNMGGMGDRQEDHVGHKVVQRDNWIAVDGNPVNDGFTYNELGAGFECDWLSKVHQGTHSSDALGNNLHEYFLNLDCKDGTHAVIKELAVWGAPSRIFNECGNTGGPDPSGDPYLHPGLIDVGFVTSDSPPVYAEDPNPENNDATETGFQTNDGKREFGCLEDKVNGYKDLLELWKADGVIRAPSGGGSVHFSAYYITKNSTRYVDPNWQQHSGWTNGLINTVDMCVKGSRVWENTLLYTNPEFASNGKYPPFCGYNNMPAALQSQWEAEITTIKNSGQSQTAIDADLVAASEARRLHPDNPFDGTRRVSHPKRIQIYNNNGQQNTPEGHTRFCTNAWGKSPVWPLANGDCPAGTIQQIISSSSNGWDGLNISGSSLNSTQANGDPQDPNDLNEFLTAPGIGEEWIRDRSGDSGVRVPN